MAANPAGGGETIRVALADDEQTMRDLLKQLLHKAGCQVVASASNGKKAVEIYGQHQPDIMLLDINMPGLGGIEALKMIKEQDPNAYVVMVSAEAQMDIVKAAMAIGISGFIVKPFAIGRINALVEAFRDKKR